jgi:hypothetical protein
MMIVGYYAARPYAPKTVSARSLLGVLNFLYQFSRAHEIRLGTSMPLIRMTGLEPASQRHTIRHVCPTTPHPNYVHSTPSTIL